MLDLILFMLVIDDSGTGVFMCWKTIYLICIDVTDHTMSVFCRISVCGRKKANLLLWNSDMPEISSAIDFQRHFLIWRILAQRLPPNYQIVS